MQRYTTAKASLGRWNERPSSSHASRLTTASCMTQSASTRSELKVPGPWAAVAPPSQGSWICGQSRTVVSGANHWKVVKPINEEHGLLTSWNFLELAQGRRSRSTLRYAPTENYTSRMGPRIMRQRENELGCCHLERAGRIGGDGPVLRQPAPPSPVQHGDPGVAVEPQGPPQPCREEVIAVVVHHDALRQPHTWGRARGLEVGLSGCDAHRHDGAAVVAGYEVDDDDNNYGDDNNHGDGMTMMMKVRPTLALHLLGEPVPRQQLDLDAPIIGMRDVASPIDERRARDAAKATPAAYHHHSTGSSSDVMDVS
jgi:hypothetical protein